MNILNINKGSKAFGFFVVAGMILFFTAVSLTTASAGQGEDLFALGNQAYAEGKYDEALSYYGKVIKKEGYSASLLYNIANAYYRKKDVGQAVLNYERALYLDPGNADIRANLGMARKDFGLISEPSPRWQQFFDLLNLNRWAILASGALGLFSLLYLLKGIRPKVFQGASFKIAAAVGLLFFVTGGTGAAMQYKNINRGVVTGGGARLLVSPFDSAASSASLKDGKIVRMAKTYKDYVRVEGPNGRSGWIQKKAIEPVVPPDAG